MTGGAEAEVLIFTAVTPARSSEAITDDSASLLLLLE
jgi:hypothetical protein